MTGSMKIPAFVLLAVLMVSSTPASAADDVKSEVKDEGTPRIEINIPKATRPSVLPAMYVSLVGLQAYDGYSTIRGSSTQHPSTQHPSTHAPSTLAPSTLAPRRRTSQVHF
jgi:hypothetical protein